ncbi:hypothetical protein ACPPVU_08840 [Mucilaginibacter sp. McL0603]|uniref:hypothetical protein n=1 Tax=Mucilaginibacter sp. McL0603 TaxID=3415670 RepID=UPI003CF5CB6D
MLTLIILVIMGWYRTDAQSLEPIDSIYLNALPRFSENMVHITSQVWPGMTIGAYAIFRIGGPVFLKNHPEPPKSAKQLKDNIYEFSQSEYALLGTSQTEINHYLTAHNNYGQPQYISANQFYSELFHELHHVYQRTVVKTVQFDNPAELLTYPEDYRNDAMRQYEDELLLSMLQGPPLQFQENLNCFYSSRLLRQTIVGKEYLDYEKSVESCEGPATFCEYQYMKAFASTPQEQQYIQKRFFEMLIEPTYGRDGLRNKRLLSGMIQCLLLDQKLKKWKPEYYKSRLSLSDFFFSKFKPNHVLLPDLSAYLAKAKYFTAIEKNKHNINLESFNNQGGLKITLLFKSPPEFRGFDPMHAEAVSDSLVLHTTLLKLGKGANYFTAANERTETLVKGSIWTVKSVTFFAPADKILLDNNILKYEGQHIEVNWHYTTETKTDNTYLITVE